MKKLWIAWERDGSIRSRVLAREMNAEFCTFTSFVLSNIFSILRYPVAIIQTINAVFQKKPDLLVVQNPSIVLAFVAALIKPAFRYRLFIDLHTIYIYPSGLKKIVTDFLNLYSLKKCTGVIVTNEFYRKKMMKNTESRVFILPDKIPDFDYPFQPVRLEGRKNILYICTFSSDEPWREVIDAAALIDKDTFIYISGRNRLKKVTIPANVILTGFLTTKDYQNLLRSVDAAMVLTSADDCLVCGAYEAVAAGKPLILSDKKVLREYFSKGAVFTGHLREEIAGAINLALADAPDLSRSIIELENELRVAWKRQWDFLLERIDSAF